LDPCRPDVRRRDALKLAAVATLASLNFILAILSERPALAEKAA